MARPSVPPAFPNGHPESSLAKRIQGMLNELYALRVELVRVPEEHAAARAKCQPVNLAARLAALDEQQQAKRVAFDKQQQAKRDLLERQQQSRRVACERQQRAVLNKLFPPSLQAQVEILTEAQDAEREALTEAQEAVRKDFEREQADALEALEKERAAALEALMPHDVAERLAAVDQEFAERQASAEAARSRLDTEIRAATKEHGKTVIGDFLQAAYMQGRRSWNSDNLLRLAERVPEIHACMKMGEPSITIRAVAQYRPPTTLLYDIHG